MTTGKKIYMTIKFFYLCEDGRGLLRDFSGDDYVDVSNQAQEFEDELDASEVEAEWFLYDRLSTDTKKWSRNETVDWLSK